MGNLDRSRNFVRQYTGRPMVSPKVRAARLRRTIQDNTDRVRAAITNTAHWSRLAPRLYMGATPPGLRRLTRELIWYMYREQADAVSVPVAHLRALLAAWDLAELEKQQCATTARQRGQRIHRLETKQHECRTHWRNSDPRRVHRGVVVVYNSKARCTFTVDIAPGKADVCMFAFDLHARAPWPTHWHWCPVP